MWRFFTLIVLSLSISAYSAAELPYTFNLSGKFYDSLTGIDPLEDANIEVRLQILNAAKTCILYDERQFVSTITSEGSYSIKVGSATGAAKRVSGSDPGNTMEQIFQNAAAVLANCSGSMTTNLPVTGAARHLRLMIKPTGAASFETLAPEISIGTVPSAFVADTLGGLTKDQFLRPGSSGNLNQINLENLFSSTNYPTLTGLLSGSSPSSGGTSAGNYVLTADNGSNNVGEIRFATGSTIKAVITNAGDFISNQKIGIGTGTIAPTTDLAFGGSTDRMVGVERNSTTNTEGKKFIIQAGGATASSTDKNGGDLYLSSGIATGTGSSKILFETTAAGATGSTDRTPTTKMVLDGAGKLGIGTSSPVGNLELLVTGTGHKGFVNRLLADDAFAAQQVFFKSRGTGPLQTGDAIGNIRFMGFDGTTDWSPTIGLAQSTAAQIRAHSAEPWTPTAHGGYLAIATTPKGSTSPADRLVIDSAGNVGVGVGLNPTATLHLRAGRAEESGAPLKFTSGPLLTIPEDGVMEYLTNKLYFTLGSTRYQIPLNTAAGTYTDVTTISNSSGNISVNPNSGAGSLIVTGAVSTGTTSGALIVSGGVAVSQNINVAGAVSTASLYSPQLYGSGLANGTIKIDGTDHTTKGHVLLASSGGNVGIGTSNPTSALQIAKPVRPELNITSTDLTNTGVIAHAAVIAGDQNNLSFELVQRGSGYDGTRYGHPLANWADLSSYGSLSAGMVIGTLNAAPLTFGTSGNEAVRISPVGRMGVGTTNPRGALHVQSNNPSDYTSFYLTAPSAAVDTKNWRYAVDGVNGDFYMQAIPDDHSYATNVMIFKRVGAAASSVNFPNANVGIGTTSPLSPIHIMTAGTAAITHQTSSTNDYAVSRFITPSHQYEWALSGAPTDAFNSFYLYDSTAGIKRLLVNSSGNVGIGTSTPAVGGSVSSRTYLSVKGSSDAGVLEMISGAAAEASGNNAGLIQFSDPNFIGAEKRVAIIQGFSSGTTPGYRGGSLSFRTKADGGTVGARMTIDHTGNVGIGTTTPNQRLTVDGSIGNASSIPNPTTTVDFSKGNLQYTTASCGAFNLHNLKDGTNYTFAVQGNTAGACSFNAFSDAGTTSLSVKYPADFGTTYTNQHSLYTFMVMGGYVYVAWNPNY